MKLKQWIRRLVLRMKSPPAESARWPRVVMDTNSLVAARWKPAGASAQLMDLCIQGRIQALISPEIRRENERIIARVRPSAAFREKLEQYFREAETIMNAPAVRVSEDPDDDKFLACALAGKADCLVSSDRHLLVLDGYGGVTICRAHRFLERQSGGLHPLRSA